MQGNVSIGFCLQITITPYSGAPADVRLLEYETHEELVRALAQANVRYNAAWSGQNRYRGYCNATNGLVEIEVLR